MIVKTMEWLDIVTAEPFLFIKRVAMVGFAVTLVSGLYLIFSDCKNQRDSAWISVRTEPFDTASMKTGSVESYLAPIRKRALFRIIENKPPQPVIVAKQVAPAVPAAPPVPVKTLADLSADLALVGVLQSGEPQAIILNRRNQKTLYVSVGDTIGEVRIVRIYQDRVTLGYNEETLDLSM